MTDTTKHVWLQGRQCWMFARVARTHSDEELAALAAAHGGASPPPPPARSKVAVPPLALTRANLVRAALAGVNFLRSHAVRADGQVYFSLTADGRPIVMRALGGVGWGGEELGSGGGGGWDGSGGKGASRGRHGPWPGALCVAQAPAPPCDPPASHCPPLCPPVQSASPSAPCSW